MSSIKGNEGGVAARVHDTMPPLSRFDGSIFITGHTNPDGDCIGACFALALALRQMGKFPMIVLEEFSSRFDFLSGHEFLYKGCVSDIDKIDVLFCLDCAAVERLGIARPLVAKADLVVNIDHHASADEREPFADINIIESKAAAACEILYEILVQNGVEITKNIAEALYVGILTDTGCFRHPTTTPKLHRIAAALHETGIDFSDVQQRVVYDQTPVEAAAFSAAIASTKIHDDMKIATAFLTYDDMQRIGAKPMDLEGIVGYIRSIKNVEIAAFFSEREKGKVHISLRSKTKSVREIAARLDGGGHDQAAGCRFVGNVKEAIAAVLSLARELYGN